MGEKMRTNLPFPCSLEHPATCAVHMQSNAMLSSQLPPRPCHNLCKCRGSGGACDIYEKGGATCVAAHSMARALYGGYAGPLYQLAKHDGSTADVHTVSMGGVADAAAHDAFCGEAATSKCFVRQIYDQSPRQNHLRSSTAHITSYHHATCRTMESTSRTQGVRQKLASI